MARGALQIDVPLIDGHFPVVPGLGTLTAGRSSAADAEVFIGESDGAFDLDSLCFGVVDKLVGDLLHGWQFGAAEGDSGAFDFLVFDTLFLIFIGHL